MTPDMTPDIATTPTDAEIEAAKVGMDKICVDMIESMQHRGVHNSHIAKAIERLNPLRVQEAFIESVEHDLFRTQHDIGASTNALLVWNRVRAAAGMDRLTMDDLVRRYVALSYADAQRAEERGDFESADRSRGIARKIMAENPKVYPVAETATA